MLPIGKNCARFNMQVPVVTPTTLPNKAQRG